MTQALLSSVKSSSVFIYPTRNKQIFLFTLSSASTPHISTTSFNHHHKYPTSTPSTNIYQPPSLCSFTPFLFYFSSPRFPPLAQHRPTPHTTPKLFPTRHLPPHPPHSYTHATNSCIHLSFSPFFSLSIFLFFLSFLLVESDATHTHITSTPQPPTTHSNNLYPTVKYQC